MSLQVIDSIYDVPKKKWNLNYKTEIINNQMGQATTVIYSNWNQSFKQWEYAEQDEFIYNLNGRQISFVSIFGMRLLLIGFTLLNSLPIIMLQINWYRIAVIPGMEISGR